MQHEVAYIQEAQSTPQTPTSTTTTNSASGGSIGNGADGASPDSDQSAMGTSNKIASATVSMGPSVFAPPVATSNRSGRSGSSNSSVANISLAQLQIKWLSRNYETADGVSLPRSTLYNHYMQHCNEQKLEPVNAASFGKLIRSVFSGLRTRRLGTRGNSKYHYYGIRIKPGSLLIHQSMEDKSMQGYGASPGNGNGNGTGNGNGSIANVSSSNANQLGSSNGSNGMSTSSGQRTAGAKKHNFKPETYEACIQVCITGILHLNGLLIRMLLSVFQYIGDGAGAMPVFPPIELSHSFHSELTLDDVDTFRALYREHCESFLDAVLNLEFGTVEFLLRDFWRTSDNNNLDECEEEKYLSKTKLYLLCHCAEVQKFVREVSTVDDENSECLCYGNTGTVQYNSDR